VVPTPCLATIDLQIRRAYTLGRGTENSGSAIKERRTKGASVRAPFVFLCCPEIEIFGNWESGSEKPTQDLAYNRLDPGSSAGISEAEPDG
jgi:hypothetical protein